MSLIEQVFVKIEGVAEILGSLADKKTKEHTDFMRSTFPESIKRWENYSGMVIVRIRPKQIIYGSRVINDDSFFKSSTNKYAPLSTEISQQSLSKFSSAISFWISQILKMSNKIKLF
jgi:hypothetical protein